VELFKTLLSAQSEGVAVVGDSGRIRYANDAMFDLLGYDEQDFDDIYEAFTQLFPDPYDKAFAAACWAEDIQGGSDEERTFEVRRGDGKRRWLAFRVCTLGDQGVALRARDVTHQKREADVRAELEEQLLQAQKMEAVGTLAGGVAHDMNNVLGVIMGFASVLQQASGDGGKPQQSKCVEGILAAARRGRDLTSNLLGFARKGSFRKERFSLNKAAREVQSLLRRTAPKSIGLELDLDEALVEVDADAGQLSQALMNLCLNGLEAMPSGGTLAIRTRTRKMSVRDSDSWINITPGPYAELVVQDEGTGMDRRSLRHAFEPFFTTKPKGQGTGLGLSMVYGTVMNHGGDIRVDSRPGQGTRVTILLPKACGNRATPEPRERPSDPSLRIPARVLLVDDERLMLQAGKVLLESLEHRVQVASSGEEALGRVQQTPQAYDVVILDMAMPRMDGAETFEALRAVRPDLPVLLCSGYPRGARVEELISAGAGGFLRKPFEMDHLADEIDRLMRDQRP